MSDTSLNFWNYENVKYLHVELSSLCNAACPNCPRYMYHSEVVNPDLDLTSVSLEQFKSWFPIDFVKQSKRWLFCGTVGDPMMAKDVYEILEYVCLNSTASIQVNTNGGTRSEEFWKKLGNLFKKGSAKRYVIFSVDGLADTNHIYRRNVVWEKVLRNMKAYASTGADSQWDFLIFKHNEHQNKEAENLSKEIGITDFALKRALGFEANGQDEYKNMIVRGKNGEFLYFIEPPSVEWRNNSQAVKEIKISTDTLHINKTTKTPEEANKYLDYQINRELKNWKFPDEHKEKTVMCKSCIVNDNQHREIYVDASGNVMPCCYIGTWFSSYYTLPAAVQIKQAVRDWGADKINLNNYSLENILSSGFLNKMFADKWDQAPEDQRMEQCFSICGSKNSDRNNSVDKIYIGGFWTRKSK